MGNVWDGRHGGEIGDGGDIRRGRKSLEIYKQIFWAEAFPSELLPT